MPKAGLAAFTFEAAGKRSSDPAFIKMNEGLTELAYAVNGIEQRQERIERLLTELVRKSRNQ